eukprot:3375007-Prymnesium_polylepis.3
MGALPRTAVMFNGTSDGAHTGSVYCSVLAPPSAAKKRPPSGFWPRCRSNPSEAPEFAATSPEPSSNVYLSVGVERIAELPSVR